MKVLLAGSWSWLKPLSACVLVGCALTPSGMKWGGSVGREVTTGELEEQIQAAAAEGGWGALTAEAVGQIAQEVVDKRLLAGMSEEESQSTPIGIRELLEAGVATILTGSWLRDRKYVTTKTLKPTG